MAARTVRLTVTLDGPADEVGAWIAEAFASGLVSDYHRETDAVANGVGRAPVRKARGSHGFKPGDRVEATITDTGYGIARGDVGTVATIDEPKRGAMTVTFDGTREAVHVRASAFHRLGSRR